ncbi:hypothetical protein Tco_1047350 [Tanacetum coccineum]
MDWLSKRKFVIVCHEKVVRIPLEGNEILRVHGERTQGVVKILLNTKVDELKFCIDLVPRATPVAKSPYHLAPLKMQELSEQLQELQDKVSVGITKEGEERSMGYHIEVMLEVLRKEKLYAKVTSVRIMSGAAETRRAFPRPEEDCVRSSINQISVDALIKKERVKLEDE